MIPTSSKWSVEFYTNARGNSPPLDFIGSLPQKERAKIYRHIKYLEEVGVLIGMPQAKRLTGSLWELRPLPHRLIYFAYTGRKFIILHAFRKKRRKHQQDIAIAKRRMEEFIARGE